MRKILAVALLVLGILGVAGGVFARVQLGNESSVSVVANTQDAGAYIVLEPGIVTSGGKPALITVNGDAGTRYGIFVGMKPDVDAFLGESKYAQVKQLNSWQTAPVTAVNSGGAASGLNPQNSDNWVKTYTGTGSFTTQLTTTDPALGPVSIVIAADGKAAAPTSLTLQWNLPVDATWTVILMGVGLVLIVAGLIALQQAKSKAEQARREAEHARKLQEAAEKASVFDEALAVTADPGPPVHAPITEPTSSEDTGVPRKREGLR